MHLASETVLRQHRRRLRLGRDHRHLRRSRFPSHFLDGYTLRAVINNYSISGLAALAVLVPLASGTFDASIGGNMSLSGVLCAYLLIHTGMSVPLSC